MPNLYGCGTLRLYLCQQKVVRDLTLPLQTNELEPALCDQVVSDAGDMTVSVENNVEYYTCPFEEQDLDNGSVYINGSYSQTATLFFVTGEDAIKHLYSRNTHLQVNELQEPIS